MLQNSGVIVDLGVAPKGTEESALIATSRSRAFLGGWVAVMAIGDVVGSLCIGLIVYSAYVGPLEYGSTQLWVGLLGFLFAWTLGASTLAIYSKRTLLGDQGALVLRGIMSCAMTFGGVLLLEFALKLIGDVSRIWLLAWATGVFVWVTSLRLFWIYHLARFFGRGGCLERALVLAGTQSMARIVGDALRRESKGRIGIEMTAGIPGLAGAPTVDWIESIIRAGRIERVIIAKFDDAIAESESLLRRLARVSVSVTIIPDLEGFATPALGVDRIGMLPAIELRSHPLTDVQVILKRAEDLILASTFLLVLAPLLAVVAIAIKLDSRGPIFFRQEREGFHNQTFWLWKFRTMHHERRDPSCFKQTSRGDARVTRVGRILRRLSFDELPQLINVLNGEMSIIGPRPHALGMTAVGSSMHQVAEEYPARYRLKPGITGWAQINGCRGEIDTHEKLQRRVYLDCYYIDNWSLSLDVWVIVRTVAHLLFDRDAY